MYKVYMATQIATIKCNKLCIGKVSTIASARKKALDMIEAHNVIVDLEVPKKVLNYGAKVESLDNFGWYDKPIYANMRSYSDKIECDICSKYVFMRKQLSYGINLRENCDVISVGDGRKVVFWWEEIK